MVLQWRRHVYLNIWGNQMEKWRSRVLADKQSWWGGTCNWRKSKLLNDLQIRTILYWTWDPAGNQCKERRITDMYVVKPWRTTDKAGSTYLKFTGQTWGSQPAVNYNNRYQTEQKPRWESWEHRKWYMSVILMHEGKSLAEPEEYHLLLWLHINYLYEYTQAYIHWDTECICSWHKT